MKKQEIFNKCLNGLRNQDWRRSRGTLSCLYQSGNGDRCAIGHLLSDEELEYVKKRNLNSMPVKDIIDQVPSFCEKIYSDTDEKPSDIVDLLELLQDWHDNSLLSSGGLNEEAYKKLNSIACAHWVQIPEKVKVTA